MRIQTLYDAVRLRSTPEFCQTNVLRLLPKGAIFEGAKRQAEWWAVTDGYVHASMVGLVEKPDIITPPDPADPLTVPYRSQWDTDAANRTCDCGQTCVAMLAAWRQIPIHIHDLLHQSTPSGLSSAKDLVNNFNTIGLSAEVIQLAPAQALTRLPAICLMYYGGLERSSVQDKKYKGWHWLVLLQQCDSHVVVHDPDFWGQRRAEGAQKQYSLAEWQRAFIPFDSQSSTCKTAIVLKAADEQ